MAAINRSHNFPLKREVHKKTCSETAQS